jgi:hypothetical protein
MSAPNFNNKHDALTGRIKLLSVFNNGVEPINGNIIIQGIDRCKYKINQRTVITNNNEVINFEDLKLNQIVTITPDINSLDTASDIVVVPEPS